MEVSDLRAVRLYWATPWVGMPYTECLVCEAKLEVFITACKKLHVAPGVNPHSGCAASRAWKITVAKFKFVPNMWWASPTLGINGIADAVTVIELGGEDVVYMDSGIMPCKDD